VSSFIRGVFFAAAVQCHMPANGESVTVSTVPTVPVDVSLSLLKRTMSDTGEYHRIAFAIYTCVNYYAYGVIIWNGIIIIITGAGDRETHRRYHCGQQRNHVLVSEAVHGSAKGKCSLILRHFSVRVVRRCSHLHLV